MKRQPLPGRGPSVVHMWSELSTVQSVSFVILATDMPFDCLLTRNWVLCGRASAAGGGLCRRLGAGRGGARAGGLGSGLGRQAASAGVTVMTQPRLSFRLAARWRAIVADRPDRAGGRPADAGRSAAGRGRGLHRSVRRRAGRGRPPAGSPQRKCRAAGGHWVHLRTTNPIEPAFATVRLRTKVTKGHGSKAAGLAMAFKLIESAQRR